MIKEEKNFKIEERGRNESMKSIVLGKEQFGLPETEARVWTNYIR